MISFDTNILVYATASLDDPKALRARDLITRAMRGMMDHLIAASPLRMFSIGIPALRIATFANSARAIDASRAQIGREQH